jgi:Homeodomain-like domain
MSEVFIRRLSARIVSHPTFQTRLQAAVCDVLTITLREEFAGQEMRLYISKTGADDRLERERRAMALLASGASASVVAAKVGVSTRQVQRWAKAGAR